MATISETRDIAADIAALWMHALERKVYRIMSVNRCIENLFVCFKVIIVLSF